MFKIKKQLDQEHKKDSKNVIIKKKEKGYNDLKIDELMEKQFKNYNIKYFK
tara:strand:- start:5571 stop:5723 length:153 start_codon:yes stop_codon:yes gene_type:complete